MYCMTTHDEPTPPITRGAGTFHDDHGVTIHTRSWVPEQPRAIVQIAHGIGEHAGRYDHVGQTLAEAGFAVYADDHRGHGETGREMHRGDLSQLGRLGPGGLRATEDALENFTEIVRSQHPDLPLVFFGHSWGSLMGQRILNRGGRLFDAVVLSGSAFRTPRHMESGDLNRNFAQLGTTGFEWLSRDPAVADQFIADELCFAANIPRLFGLRDAAKLLGTPGKQVPDLPMLIMSGTDDPLSRGDSLERLAAAYRNRGVEDVTLKLYPGGRHEMLNELNRDEVETDLVAWINTHLTPLPR